MWQPQGFFNDYTLRTPVVLSGEGSIRGLFNYPAERIAVIHGSFFDDIELYRSTFSKKEVRFFLRSWKGEPEFEGLRELVSEIETFKPDVIIAVGGGSVIDGSKLCRLLYEFPLFDQKASRVDGSMLKTRFIAVPTTVGSGAEVSSAAVFWDNSKHRKDMVVIHELQPEVVVYDPRYISGTPNRLLCASGLDAMAHILEGYVSNVQNAFVDVLAEKGLAILHEEFEALLSNKKVDYGRLQYTGYIGGIVQNHCIVGAAHAVAHQLTEQGYSHGESVALLLPSVIRLNMDNRVAHERYTSISKRAGFDGIESMVTFIISIAEYAGIYDRSRALKDYLSRAMDDETFRENIKADRGGKGNPVEITDGYLQNLIRGIVYGISF